MPWESRLRTPKIAIFPVKFPVSREFALETGAISTASPASQTGFREDTSSSSRKARRWRAFTHLMPVSIFPLSASGRPNRRKSRPGSGDIPVFGILRPETWFDPDCRVRVAESVSQTRTDKLSNKALSVKGLIVAIRAIMCWNSGRWSSVVGVPGSTKSATIGKFAISTLNSRAPGIHAASAGTKQLIRMMPR